MIKCSCVIGIVIVKRVAIVEKVTIENVARVEMIVLVAIVSVLKKIGEIPQCIDIVRKELITQGDGYDLYPKVDGVPGTEELLPLY